METASTDTIAGSIATANVLSIPGVANGRAVAKFFVNGETDQDWFRITLTEGELYQFAVNRRAGPSLDATTGCGTRRAP